MPVVDLITPWASDPDGFASHAPAHLERIRRQRTPTEPRLPAPTSFGPLVDRARDTSLHQLLRDSRDRLADRGLRAPRFLVLVASSAPGAVAEVLPDPGGNGVALFLDRADDDALVAALAAAMAQLTRWLDPVSPIAAHARRGDWDRWAVAREVPLLEWIYSAGLGVHARTLVAPDAPAHHLLELSRGAFERLRRDERALSTQLAADLPSSGLGVVLRWLEDAAPPALRRDHGDTTIPAGAGRYLAWRELRDRVARLGVAQACGVEAG